MPNLVARARTRAELQEAPQILVLAKVWDRRFSTSHDAAEGARALATASRSIAATFGYPD